MSAPCSCRRSPRPALGILAALALVLATGACATSVSRTPVFNENDVEVFLRAETKGGKVIDRGFSHPVTIAPARVTNILARIDVRDREAKDKDTREAAVPSGVLYAIGQGVAKALEEADSSQVVVVMATERTRSMGIFTNVHLTSLIVWVKDDRLFVHLGDLGTVLSRDPRDKPREPELDRMPKGRDVLGGDGMTPQGPALVAIDWRSDLFRDTSAVRVRPSGEVVRRTILLESPPEPDPAGQPGPAPPPEGLSPDALRALADLEEERRGGQLTESEYQERRRQILSGQAP